MVNIKGQEIPSNKNISISLTYIYGIGRTRAEELVKECAINPYTKTKDLTEEQIEQVSRAIGKHTIGKELRNEIKQIIDAQIKLGSWKGKRRSVGKNVRGRSSHHNNRTRPHHSEVISIRKKGLAIAGKKKAPSPK